MQLSRNGNILALGKEVVDDDISISYESLLSSETARVEWGVDVIPNEEPEPVRRVIPKSVVQARVIALGKIEAVWALLNADIANLVRWLAPDWPNVYFDDEGMLQILAAVGFTGAQIEEITAP